MLDQGNDARKRLIIDYLLKMYSEQNSHGLHRETQRSAATTIFTGLATALLALIGASWRNGVELDASFLPLTGGLMIVGLAGVILMMKTFERSQVNFTIAEAYRHTADFILAEDVKDLVGDRVGEIKYVARISDFIENPESPRPYRISFRGNKKMKSYVDDDEYKAIIRSHNPIDPREVVIPKQNAVATWLKVPWVWFDTHKVWAFVHGIYFAIGFGLSGWAIANSLY